MNNTMLTLAGTLMLEDTPLAEFVIENDSPTRFVKLADSGPFWPYEMLFECNGWTLIDALKERVVPPSRYGIIKDLQAVGIQGYDISAIITHQNGSCWDDRYWVRFKTGPQTWSELRKKIGYTN